MIQRTHLVPVHHMADRLSDHLPSERATPEAAMMLLHRMGYAPDDIYAGIDDVMALLADAATAAASNRPWARALGVVRDLTACAAIIACIFVWSLPA